MCSLIKKIPGESLSAIESINCINSPKATLRPIINHVDHINKEVLNSLEKENKTYLSVNSVDCEAEERHFPVEAMSYNLYTYRFHSTVELANAIM
jgi:hypothetical protein